MVSERQSKSSPLETQTPSRALHAQALGAVNCSRLKIKRETPMYKSASCFGRRIEITAEQSHLRTESLTSTKALLLLVAALLSVLPARSQTQTPLPEGPGKEIVQTT